MNESSKILIIGASGFVGSNLLMKFEKLDQPINVLSRNPNKVNTNKKNTTVFTGDLENKESLKAAVDGIETIYYLSHAMAEVDNDFESLEKKQVENLCSVIKPSVKVIYLSGIIPNEDLSKHLRSRKSVGEILHKNQNTVIEFRASIIIGSGSTSFEMVRALVQRLPFILYADWSNSLCQPIDIDSVIDYLYLSKDKKFNKSNYYDIGGIESLKYKDLLVRYAEFLKLRRPELYVKQFPKSLAADMLGILLPEYSQVGTSLIESIEHETILTDDRAVKTFNVKPINLIEMFDKSREIELEDLNYSEFFKFLKNNKELPDYLKTQNLTYYFDISSSFKIDDFVSKIPLAKAKKNDKGFIITIPFTGKISLKVSSDYKQLIIIISAKYFFQKTWFSLINNLINKVLDKL